MHFRQNCNKFDSLSNILFYSILLSNIDTIQLISLSFNDRFIIQYELNRAFHSKYKTIYTAWELPIYIYCWNYIKLLTQYERR